MPVKTMIRVDEPFRFQIYFTPSGLFLVIRASSVLLKNVFRWCINVFFMPFQNENIVKSVQN